MSHFSVCVIVPDDGVVNNIHANNLEDHLIPVLAPFDEQTEDCLLYTSDAADE